MRKKKIFEIYTVLYMVCLLLAVAFILTAKIHAAAFFNLLMWIFYVLAYCLWKEG